MNAAARARSAAWGALLLLAAARPAAAAPVPGVRIGSISIETGDVFSDQQVRDSIFLYGWANAIHIQTQDAVVRRELLFKEGDPYDPALLAETERNLRAQNFIRAAKVEAVESGPGEVRVLVRTDDSWTLEPRADFKKVGGQESLRLGVVEQNLLGFGKKVTALYESRPTGDRRTFSYSDPQWLGKRLKLNLEYLEGADLTSYTVSLTRPFYATIAGFTAGLSAGYEKKEHPFYSGGVETGRFTREHDEASVSFGKSLGSTPELARRLTLAVTPQKDEFKPVSGVLRSDLPADKRATRLDATMQWQRIEFIKEKHIQKYDRDEDFNVGLGAVASLGVAPRLLGSSEDQLFPGFTLRDGRRWAPGHFGLATLKGQGRWSSRRTDNMLATLTLNYYRRWSEDQTLAVQVAYDHSRRMDPDQILLLGGDKGLHGYPIDAFSGDRRLLFNMEQRAFFAEDLWNLFSFAGVAFFDSGFAWPQGRPLDLRDLKSSVGLGLRWAFSRSTDNIPIRFDLARALNDNGRSSRWVFSIQTGQAFGGLQ